MGLESGKIESADEKDYDCDDTQHLNSSNQEICKDYGEKIRDWTVDTNIRLRDLKPGTPTYVGHTQIWARHKNKLGVCMQKFNDNKCGPPNLPVGFAWEWAENMANAPAPHTEGFVDFVRRGGLILGLFLVPVGFSGAAASLPFWLTIPSYCPLCSESGLSGHSGDDGFPPE